MKSKIYIILFIILYAIVAFSSFFHSIEFFALANQQWMGVILALAFEIGQAAVLLSILTTNERKKITAWVLMFILTLVQIIGNVYSSYKYILTNSSENLRFFKEPIFIWTDLPDAQTTVIVTYITSAILPLCALLLTAMVTGFLNKKDEGEEIEYVEEEEGDEEPTEEIEEPKEEIILEDTPSEEALKKFEEIKKEREKEEPKITIDEETGEITAPMVGSHKNYYIPPKTEVEEIKGTDPDGGVIGEEGVDGMEILKKTEEKPVEEHEDKEKSHFINM